MDRSPEQRQIHFPFWLWPLITGLAWGVAEATWFFVVPDVLLCYWALRSGRKVTVATIAVVAGAMLGAAGLYLFLAQGGPENYDAYDLLHHVWASFPGFGPKMVDVASGHLTETGARGLLSGPSSGIPYRVYVLEAWKLKLPLESLLFWTPAARLERIVIAPILVTALRWIGRRFVAPAKWDRILTGVVVLYWVLLYTWYWLFLVPKLYS